MQRICYSLLILCLFSCLISNPFKRDIQEHRSQYKDGFLKDPRSPLNKDDLPFLSFYAPDENFKILGTFSASNTLKTFDMPTYSGITKPYATFGTIEFMLNGRIYNLEVYKSMQMPSNPIYANHLFLPFKDITNGEETYGGGRYMDLKTSDIVNNTIILDFNKCYNPWCAYSDGYNCPVPTLFNHLDVVIKAGEKKFKGAYKKK